MSQTSFENARSLWGNLRYRFLQPAPEENLLPAVPFTTEHMERREVFDLRWEYYRSRQKPPLSVRVGQKDTNIIENYTKQIVNDSVYFLFGAGGVSFEIGATEAGSASEAEKIIEDFWKPEGWNPAVFLEKLGQSGAVTGNPFVRLYTTENKVTFSVVDPSMVDVITAEDNIDRVIEYQLNWYSKEKQEWFRHRITLEDGGESWMIYEEENSGDGWIVVPDGETIWEFQDPPVFHCQNLPLAHEFWGLADIEDAALNDSINEITTDMRKILHYFAAPTVALYGYSPALLKQDIIQTEAGAILPISNPAAKLETVEMKSELKASSEFRRDLRDTYNSISDNVKLDPSDVNFGQLSGFAIQLLYLPLIAKTEKKRNAYGNMLSQMNRAVLQLLGGMEDPPHVKTVWPNVLPRNPEEMARIASVLAPFTNVSGALAQAGYSPDEVESMTERMINYDITQ